MPSAGYALATPNASASGRSRTIRSRCTRGTCLPIRMPTGESIPISAAKLLTPTAPSKMVALVDNYHALVAKLGHAYPS